MDININHVIAAAEKGGEIIENYFGEILDLEEKSNAADFRTKANVESEQQILAILKTYFPDFNIYSEEAGSTDNKSEYTFVVDPLDGSNNFMLGIPAFAVSIGLLKDEEIVAGVIHHPILKDTYHAEKGKGAFLKAKRLNVSLESDITRSTLSYSCGYINSSQFEENLVHQVNAMNLKRLLQNWCPTYDFCLLAAGKIEGIVNNENELYDYCAGKIIAKEAGAKVTDFEGKPEINDKSNKFLITNSTKIHDELLNSVLYKQ